MNKLLGIVFLLPLYTFALEYKQIGDTDRNGINFLKNIGLSEVKKRAHAEHKFIFLDCYASWCGPCRDMDKEVYSDGRVGDVFNRNFLSIKVQCDSSQGVGEAVSRQNKEAHMVSFEFHISSYPTLLFISPEGDVLQKAAGYQPASELIVLAQEALDPNFQYGELLRRFRKGQLECTRIPGFFRRAIEFGDSAEISSIIQVYVGEYLKKVPDAFLHSKDNFEIMQYCMEKLSSEDRIVSWLINHPETADSIMAKKGFSNGIINYVIFKEEIEPVIRAGKKTGTVPNWNLLNKTVSGKYGSSRADKVILKGMSQWFYFKREWESYCAISIERIESGGIKDNLNDFTSIEILNSFAYEIFQRSNDEAKLRTALSWSELIAAKITDSFPHAGDLLDTQAELLYKLGKIDEALVVEDRASKIAPNRVYIRDALEKMRDGKPTW